MKSRSRSRLVVVAERRICLDGRVVAYVVKRSSLAKHIRFEIRDGTGLTIVVPKHCNLNALDDMLKSKSRWILNNIDRFGQATQSARQNGLRFGDTVPYLGQEVRIVSCRGIESADSIELQGHTLLVYQDVGQPRLDSLVEQWYRSRAAKVLKQRADELAARLGVRYRRFTIRGQRTRWASCSHRGTLSFNWRLMMAPDPVVDYVVLHEMAHLKEMNHTKRFWSLVTEHCPSWRKHKKWLSDHGVELAARLHSVK